MHGNPAANAFRRNILCNAMIAALAAGFGAASAHAQDTQTTSQEPPAQQATVKRSFDIPRQSAVSALNELASQADITLVFSSDLVSGATINSVKGNYSVTDALRVMLEGTALSYQQVGGSTIAISRRTDSTATTTGSDQDQTHIAQSTESQAVEDGNKELRKVREGSSATSEVTEMPTMIVTGSRLRQSASEDDARVRMYTKEQIDQSGRTTLSEYLNTLPEVSLSNGIFGSTLAGAGTVQLRGLPVGTTLILVNGRRVESAGIQAFQLGSSFFDLNTIPVAAVDRIEIIPTGSSAVYGSDALAGVVNIILRKDMDGLEVNAKYGAADGIDETNVNVALGKRWDKLSVSLIGSLQRRGELTGAERAVTSSGDFRMLGGPDTRAQYCRPGNVYAPVGQTLTGLGGATVAGVPAGFTGTPSIAEFMATAGVANKCGPTDFTSYIIPSHRDGVFVSATYSFSPSIELFAELLYSEVEQVSGGAPPFLFANDSFRSFTVSASNPFNPFGQTVGISGLMPELGRQKTLNSTDYLRSLLGVRGTLPGAWDWELSAVDSADDSTFSIGPRLNSVAVQAALNSSDPATALNPFIDGPMGSPQLLQSLLNPDASLEAHSRRTSVAGFVRGPLFELPAGSADLVIGADYNRDSLVVDIINFPGRVAGSRLNQRRDFYAGFGELRLPLLPGKEPSDEAMLAIHLAGRYDHYDVFGSETTPQVSIGWKPAPSFSLRASYGESFRAPSLAQIYTSQVSPLTTVVDPRNGNQPFQVSTTLGGNPNLDAETGVSRVLSAAYASRAVPGLKLSAAYWNVVLDSSIQTIAAQVMVNNENLFQSRVIRNSAGFLTSIDSTYVNFGRLEVAGFDFGIDYELRTDAGILRPSLSATRTNRYQSALLPGVEATDRVSKANDDFQWAPRWKGTASLNWSSRSYSANVAARYTGRYRDYGPLTNGSFQMLGNDWFFDANVRYNLSLGNRIDWLQSAYVEFGAVNLLDSLPPYSTAFSSTSGFDPAQGDIRGRFIYGQFGVKW